MAMSLNRAQLIGNVTRDPELRQIPGGQMVVTFGVATNFAWTDANGQRQEKTEFHNVVAWRKLAEIVGQFVKKGSKVYVEGRIQTRDWEGEDGVKRYRTEIVADNVIMLDRKPAMTESGDTGNFSGSERRAGSLNSKKAQNESTPIDAPKADSQNMTSSTVAVEASEEVTIDDLPF